MQMDYNDESAIIAMDWSNTGAQGGFIILLFVLTTQLRDNGSSRWNCLGLRIIFSAWIEVSSNKNSKQVCVVALFYMGIIFFSVEYKQRAFFKW